MEYIFNLHNDFFYGISLLPAGDMKYDIDNPNRLALFKVLNLNPKKVYGLNQTHSQVVLVVDSNNPPTIEADGMITNDKSIVLSVTVADCLPVYLIDNVSGAFGIVHSGWKGTGIACNALNMMKKNYGTNACDVTAILGPCIGVCCYKVDAERAAVFENNYGAKQIKKDNGSFYLDLKEVNKNLLEKEGVINITVSDNCTCCDERFGSFRREGGGFTKMMALVGAGFPIQKIEVGYDKK